ncbi:hypothetical protein CONPUDRAFT_70154 [Coniophora puteana RWD-64-598 SS2]|uniref:DUF6532 domain-containing protein n=1 Tax=Coniophora puteana (strain RWD-64-598) TaxID=741705 RepID=A0A5M3N215_CONPW|nr:uncharacterized protein CONPUDRAFT_70154 [Coniophora puteana RWD-64-598 SS2]EIW85317.1 hypothetical protein CONPUDRAFT_70154 [Coniophora puteana RWD-64-598 SS2]
MVCNGREVEDRTNFLPLARPIPLASAPHPHKNFPTWLHKKTYHCRWTPLPLTTQANANVKSPTNEKHQKETCRQDNLAQKTQGKVCAPKAKSAGTLNHQPRSTNFSTSDVALPKRKVARQSPATFQHELAACEGGCESLGHHKPAASSCPERTDQHQLLVANANIEHQVQSATHCSSVVGISQGLRVVVSNSEDNDNGQEYQNRNQSCRDDMPSSHRTAHSTATLIEVADEPPNNEDQNLGNKDEDKDNPNLIQPLKLHNLNCKSSNISDYALPVKTLFMYATSYFLVFAITRGIWANNLTLIRWAKEAWGTACDKFDSNITYDYNILGMMKCCISTTMGNVKNINTTSTYAVRDGLYEHLILQKALNVAWFSGSSDAGVKHSKLFKPLPIPALALLWTAICCRIDEWKSNSRCQTVKFKCKGYGKHLQAHTGNMKKFECVAVDADSDIFDVIRRDLLRAARVHAGVAPNSDDTDKDVPNTSDPLEDDAFTMPSSVTVVGPPPVLALVPSRRQIRYGAYWLSLTLVTIARDTEEVCLSSCKSEKLRVRANLKSERQQPESSKSQEQEPNQSCANQEADC